MSVAFASFRSWKCFVARSGSAPDVLCVELIWAISGIMPRIVVCGHLGPALSPSNVEDPASQVGEATFVGPSGHRYGTSEITPWKATLARVLKDPPGDRSQSVVVTAIGIDVDSSEAIARRAFDLLVGVLSAREDSLSDDDLAELLAERSAIWKSW